MLHDRNEVFVLRPLVVDDRARHRNINLLGDDVGALCHCLWAITTCGRTLAPVAVGSTTESFLDGTGAVDDIGENIGSLPDRRQQRGYSVGVTGGLWHQPCLCAIEESVDLRWRRC